MPTENINIFETLVIGGNPKLVWDIPTDNREVDLPFYDIGYLEFTVFQALREHEPTLLDAAELFIKKNVLVDHELWDLLPGWEIIHVTPNLDVLNEFNTTILFKENPEGWFKHHPIYEEYIRVNDHVI